MASLGEVRIGVNAAHMIHLFSLGIVQVSFIEGHNGCDEDKEHANRAPP